MIIQLPPQLKHYLNDRILNAHNKDLALEIPPQKEVQGGKWIGRRGAIEWSARSPDLTPLDFFLWVYLKHKVYVEKITSIQHLKEVITRHIEELKTNTGLLREVMYGVSTRINQCIAVDGAHFEQRR